MRILIIGIMLCVSAIPAAWSTDSTTKQDRTQLETDRQAAKAQWEIVKQDREQLKQDRAAKNTAAIAADRTKLHQDREQLKQAREKVCADRKALGLSHKEHKEQNPN